MPRKCLVPSPDKSNPNKNEISHIHIFDSSPLPIKKFFYRCDKTFHLDDLLKLYEECDKYAVVLVSGKRTDFYLYSTTQTKLLKSIREDLPSQHKTGGQSAQRFGRIRDEMIGWYVKKIAELMTQYYVKNGIFQYQGLIIAGPAEIKDMVKEEDLFVQNFKKHLLKTLVVSEITDQSITQVIIEAVDVLCGTTEKTQIENFEKILNNPKTVDLLLFGTGAVLKAFEMGHLREIYVSDKFHDKDYIIKTTTKTQIHLVESSEFIKKYGEVVGIKYIASSDSYYDEYNENSDCNEKITEI